MNKLPIASAVVTNLLFGATDVLASAIPVTMDNFNQAVAAKYMGNWDKRGADKAIVHLPILVPAGNKAPVVRVLLTKERSTLSRPTISGVAPDELS